MKKCYIILMLLTITMHGSETTGKFDNLSPRALLSMIAELGQATAGQLKKSLSQKSLGETTEDATSSAQEDQESKLTLTDAVAEGLQASVRFLLESKSDVNYPSETGETPLTIAAKYNRLEIAQLLVARKANIHLQNGYSQTPLTIAQDYQHHDFATWLKGLKAR